MSPITLLWTSIPTGPQRIRIIETTKEEEILEKGDHYVEVALTDVIFFIRPDHLIPMAKGGQCVDEVDFDHPECIGFVENAAEYEYYNDNGYEKDYENPAHITVFRMEAEK